MATADRTLMLKLIADVSQPTKQMKGLSGTLKKSASAAKAWGKALTGALIIGGIETLVGSLDDAMKGFKEGEDASRTLGQTWKNLGRDTDQLAGTLDTLGDKALDLGFDDAEVITAFNTFLTKTGSVRKSNILLGQAMDLARARGISFARAVKIVSGNLDLSDEALARNRRQARIWARNHPLEVGLGKINDLWSDFVGFFSKGNVNKAFAALGGIGEVINDLLFGQIGKGGTRSGGLIDRFVGIGQKLVPAIIQGLSDLGNQIGLAFTAATTGVDFGKLLGDAVAAGIALVSSNSGVVTNLGILAVSLATGMFVIDIFANALSSLFKAPKFLFNAGMRAALFAAGLLLGKAMAFAMFVGEKALTAFSSGLSVLFGKIGTGPDTPVGKSARLLGRGIQLAIIAGLVFGFLELLRSEIDKILDDLGVPRDVDPVRDINKRLRAKYGLAEGGIVTGPTVALLGERGPEAVIPLSGTGGGMGITVNITTGVGDPVEIGRQVDRVLRAYRGRAGLAA